MNQNYAARIDKAIDSFSRIFLSRGDDEKVENTWRFQVQFSRRFLLILAKTIGSCVARLNSILFIPRSLSYWILFVEFNSCAFTISLRIERITREWGEKGTFFYDIRHTFYRMLWILNI